jgi:hypothetical protein
LIDIFFKDLENSSQLATIAINSRSNLDYVKQKIPEFRAKAELSYPTYGRFMSHFKNFVNSELKKEAESKRKPPSNESKIDLVLNVAEQLNNEIQAKYK